MELSANKQVRKFNVTAKMNSKFSTENITSSFLLPINYIGVLNEMAQKVGAPFPEYKDLVAEGLPHCRVFTISCSFGEHVTHGRGYTVKAAKQAAAKAWFEIYSLNERAVRTSKFEYVCNVSAKTWSLGKALLGWDQMGEDEVKKALSRIAMNVASLAANLTPTGMSIFIVQLAVEFGYTLDVLATKLIELFTTLAEHSTQLIQNVIAGIRQLLLPIGQNVVQRIERYRNDRARDRAIREVARRTAIEMPEFTPQLIAGAAGALGGCAVLIAAMITGAKDFSSQKGFIKSITEFSTKIAKTKAGIFALIDMVKTFHVYVRDSVLAYLGQGVPSTIVRAYESLNPKHQDVPIPAEKFFEMIETLNSIDGENNMGINSEALKDGEFVLYYISKITTQNMTEKFAIPANAAAGLMATQRALEQRVKIARIKHGARESKFDPFCIWLTGDAGVGKSTAVAFINTWLQSFLSKDPERFQLPAQDRMCFSANFTQEYHTGYNGQYIFTIDDMCQDKPHLLKNSSLMFFINAKSRVPSNVTQAALEDKLCPFDSKIMICTSNVSHPNRDKEIHDRDALLRRRNMLVRMQMDDSFPFDPVLQRKVKFTLIDPMDDKKIDTPIARYETFSDLMRDIVTQYVAHYDAELALDGKTADTSAAENFAEKLWNERAVATMYKIPTMLKPAELIRQCKFEASRLKDCFSDIVRKYHWKLLVGISAIAAAAFATYQYMRKRVDVVCEDDTKVFMYATDSNNCGLAALVDPDSLVIYGVGYEDATCDHELNNHVRDCPEAMRQLAEWEKKFPEERALATYESKIMRAKPASKPTYNKELVRARAAARAIRSSFVEAMNIKSVVKVGITVNGQRREMNGVFIKDRFMLTCRHLFIGAKDGDPITITEYPQFSQPRVSEHMFEENRMKRVKDGEDSVVYEMGFEVKSHRDITERFFQEDLPESFYAASVAVYPYQSCIEGRTQVLTRHVDYAMDDEETEFAVVRGFEMLERTAPGRSGSPIVTDERANRAPTIFGIQTSMMDNGTRGYFEAITKSQIRATLKEFEQEKAVATMHYEPVVPEEMQHMCKQSLIYVCPAEKPVFQMQQTRLERSSIAAEYEIDDDLTEFVPSALRGRKDGKPVDVLAKSMAGFDRKYGRVDTRLADEVLREIVHEDRSVRKIRGLSPRLLTDHEVMNGLEGQGLKGVETKTSPGLPLVHMKQSGKPGKETWISRDENEQRVMCPEMWKLLREHEEMLKAGEAPPYLAYACLKDELRPLAKVQELKTRSFIILPMLMNLLIRKYFGMWIAVQHGLHNKISSSVGIDVNTEWTTLARRLLKVGSAIEDFDYADWDRSLHAEWFRVYADRVSSWYGDRKGSQGWRVRMKLMDILAHMPIQIGSHIVQTSGGNKSGCAITAEINSDVHDMLMLYVWKKVCQDTGKPELAGIEAFRDRVALALYGDDVVKATSVSVAKWFNGNAICLEVEKLGMKITPGDKISTEFRIKTLDEVTFLKRRFMKMDEDCGEYRAPLDKAVIQRMMLWVHKSDEPLEACAANVKGALCEAFFWGEAFYNETMDRVVKAWNYMDAGGKPLPSVTYHALWYNWTNKIRSELVPAQFQYSSGVRLETPEGAEV
uniref:Nonstructural polyprotein n=1 Tax=Picornavirales sp. TaxID=1955153 RepID=A0A6M9ZAG7_9VIRU|nr:MAG: nonstructural polyprotein [Picornavirales sp.]QKN88977.1 MAG: nonstructural polyprotein [Picornavirales sp.]QKN88979.1 MAG: nonstructural polyprotein [Picornavirales sp.]